jgi:hypothetical protein
VKIAIVKKLEELWEKVVTSAEDLINKEFVIMTKSDKQIKPLKAFCPLSIEWTRMLKD